MEEGGHVVENEIKSSLQPEQIPTSEKRGKSYKLRSQVSVQRI